MAMNYKEVVKRPHDSWSRESKTWFLANSTFGLLHTQNTSQCFAEDLIFQDEKIDRKCLSTVLSRPGAFLVCN